MQLSEFMAFVVDIRNSQSRSKKNGTLTLDWRRSYADNVAGLRAGWREFDIIASFIQNSNHKYKLDLSNQGIQAKMLEHLIPAEISKNIVSLDISNNRLDDAIAPLIASILIASTHLNHKIPKICYNSQSALSNRSEESNPNRLSKPIRDKLNEIKISLNQYLSSKRFIKSIQVASIVICVLVGLAIVGFNAACLAVAAGIHSPVLALIAALSTFVGGSMGVSLIGFAVIGTIKTIETALFSLFDERKEDALVRAGTLKSEIISETQEQSEPEIELNRELQRRMSTELVRRTSADSSPTDSPIKRTRHGLFDTTKVAKNSETAAGDNEQSAKVITAAFK